MKLVVGLGNPGKKYEKTRHNIGFVFLDKFLEYLNLGDTKYNTKYNAEILKSRIGEEQIVFVKPMTFMNKSGSSVQSVANFFEVEIKDILILHDDIDLDFGVIKSKVGGGHAGHNGLRDIIAKLGSGDFERVRIGVGRPTNKDEVTDYVLGNFPKKDREEMEGVVAEVFGRIENFLGK